jgi:hypothetical protein
MCGPSGYLCLVDAPEGPHIYFSHEPKKIPLMVKNITSTNWESCFLQPENIQVFWFLSLCCKNTFSPGRGCCFEHGSGLTIVSSFWSSLLAVIMIVRLLETLVSCGLTYGLLSCDFSDHISSLWECLDQLFKKLNVHSLPESILELLSDISWFHTFNLNTNFTHYKSRYFINPMWKRLDM